MNLDRVRNQLKLLNENVDVLLRELEQLNRAFDDATLKANEKRLEDFYNYDLNKEAREESI